MDVDLSLVSIEDLMKEVGSRFDDHIFCGTKKVDGEKTQMRAFNSMYAYACLGLCDYLRQKFLNYLSRVDAKYEEPLNKDPKRFIIE